MAIPRRQTVNGGSGNGEVVELLAKSALQAIRDPNAPPTAANQRRKSRVLVALRTFGLTLFPSLQSEQPEQLKIAIQKDRLDACIGCLIHIIPLAGAVALLVLNFSWYYVGTNFDCIVALQFAAKLHEMTVIASLSYALLSCIRYDLTSKTGLPFGAAFAGLRVTQLSYLWSPELWGSLNSKSYSWKFKLRIALAIFFVALLMATVGPASAASMIPRRARWFGEHVMLATNATEDTMFPTHLTLDSYSSSNENCSESIFDDSKLPCPWSTDIISRASILSLGPTLNNMTYYDNLGLNIHPNVSFRTGSWLTFGFPIPFTISLQTNLTDLGSDQSIISVASSVQARGLLQFSTSTLRDSELFYSNSLSVDTDDGMDAYSRVQCFNHTVIWNISDSEPALSFSARSGQPDITDYITNTKRELLLNNARASNGYSVDLIFVDLPDLDTSGVILIRSAESESYSNRDDFLVTPCTLELGWFYTELGYNGQIVTSQGPPEPGSSKIRRAYADRDWLATTNPFLEDVNMTAMNFLSLFVENLDLSQAPSIISTLTAVTLSAMSPTSIPFGIMRHDSRIPLPTFGWQEYDLKVMKNFPLKFPQRIYRSGYGYGPNVLAVKISLAILILYCLIAVAHIVYSIVTGTTSTAWDFISEIVALALNSRPASELQYTCAGIQTTHVFEHNVRIASTTGTLDSKTEVQRENLASEPVGRHLELLFPSQDGHVVSTVMANAKYGAFKEKLD